MQFFYKPTCGISLKDIHACAQTLSSYKKHLSRVTASGAYTELECSLVLPYDATHARVSKKLAKEKTGKALKYVFVIGIGGSNLGAKAVYDAIRGYSDICTPRVFPKIYFLDTVDPEMLAAYQKLCASIHSQEELLIVSISKSGGTTETIANTEYMYAWLKKKFPRIQERIVVITDKDSLLWKESVRMGIARLPIPALVGGRYSVFSSVGLFPLAVVGCDISLLIAGAKEVKKDSALMSAVILFLQAKNGHTIHDNFFFHPELESLGKWYRQLFGESIGKESENGARVGITPTVSLGSVDLHSVGQLYLGGPRDKTTTFVYTAKGAQKNPPAYGRLFSHLIPELHGVSAQSIMSAIFRGVQAAYKKQSLPYMSLVLPDISEYSLGMYLQWKMTEIMYLGKLFKVNAFDQPHVELYKKETKKILMLSK
jgi:glucose-6-phosphate isomerase